jgi:uncharacterized protein YjbI with pentapeptide repeats
MANEEHLNLLKQGVDAWNRWREENPGMWLRLSEADLRGADLSGANLRGADLSGANLNGADLSEADLSGANLGVTNLSEANLRETNLSEANLSRADLGRADLRGADLRGADLYSAEIDDTTQIDGKWRLVWEIVNQPQQGRDLQGARLSGANLKQAYLRLAQLNGAHLEGAHLRWTHLEGAHLEGAHLERANLEGVHLNEANLEGAHLNEANLSKADLSGARLFRANLRGADLRGANLRGADLNEANLNEANLRRADLSGANLPGANLNEENLEGADLRRANLPGANLRGANLEGADLRWANLPGANLSGANLERARLFRANLNEANLSGAKLIEANLNEVERVEALDIYEKWARSMSNGPGRIPVDDITVDFTVFHPGQVLPERWYKLLVYVHLPSAPKAVFADRRSQLGAEAGDFWTTQDRSKLPIKREAEIVIVPELPGHRFNPPRASLLWLEAWHRTNFQMQAEPDLPGFELDRLVTGRVAFYVGPILVGEVRIFGCISNDAGDIDPESPDSQETGRPYQSIFVSYSQQDAAIVDELEKAYTVLGMKYLRDVRALRSGQKWNRALLGMIEKADIFQLCWSNNAKASHYVEQEWRHAFSLGRPYFIRPVYWEQPMPPPPPELSDIHFAYLKKADEG